ncbi:hypothetical protein PIB30_106458 [Stylosanthes scabra]|uniref:Uncharacterized protein n=1 Tax=Stylosanthes scabra TaxID=79078 RepID=A0ABU6RZA5_9FABA|nr:hypothetical protein [Stylosanthes scabra]
MVSAAAVPASTNNEQIIPLLPESQIDSPANNSTPPQSSTAPVQTPPETASPSTTLAPAAPPTPIPVQISGIEVVLPISPAQGAWPLS